MLTFRVFQRRINIAPQKLVSLSKKMFYRTSSVLCVFIIFIHLMFLRTSDGNTVDQLIHQQAKIVLPPHVEKGSEDSRKETVIEEVSEVGLQLESRRKSDADSRSSGDNKCRYGHIQGYAPVCENLPCLRLLRVDKSFSSTTTTDDPITADAIRRINNIPGWVDQTHFTVIPFITDMQWSHSIYGSVGAFGISVGKLAALLARKVDIPAGERLLISDSFESTTTNRFSGLTQFDIFESYMRDLGFDEQATGAGRLNVHRGGIADIDRRIFVDLNLPQFRLISVDGDLDIRSLMAAFESSVCLLRDGGILMVDEMMSGESRSVVEQTLTAFFSKYGKSAIAPILRAGNKLYLTTTNWRRKYMDYIQENDDQLTHIGLTHTMTSSFMHDYYVLR